MCEVWTVVNIWSLDCIKYLDAEDSTCHF